MHWFLSVLFASSFAISGNAADSSLPVKPVLGAPLAKSVPGNGPFSGKKLLATIKMSGSNSYEESKAVEARFGPPEWVVPTPNIGGETLMSPNRAFQLTFVERPEEECETAEYQVFITHQGKKTLLTEGTVGTVVFSPDSKFIVAAGRWLIDTDGFKKYDMHAFLPGSHGEIERWSKDGKRMIVSYSDAAYDPPPDAVMQYWEVTLK